MREPGKSIDSDAACLGHWYSVLRLWEGLKSRPNLSPGTCDVESTVFNCPNLLGKRVADSKHGFESRWGHYLSASGYDERLADAGTANSLRLRRNYPGSRFVALAPARVALGTRSPATYRVDATLSSS